MENSGSILLIDSGVVGGLIGHRHPCNFAKSPLYCTLERASRRGLIPITTDDQRGPGRLKSRPAAACTLSVRTNRMNRSMACIRSLQSRHQLTCLPISWNSSDGSLSRQYNSSLSVVIWPASSAMQPNLPQKDSLDSETRVFVPGGIGKLWLV